MECGFPLHFILRGQPTLDLRAELDPRSCPNFGSVARLKP